VSLVLLSRSLVLTHATGLLSDVNLNKITELPIDKLVVTNTVPQTAHAALCSKLDILDVSATIAESIRRTHNGESISLLFGDWTDIEARGSMYQ
jgi:ribose-phosphate pyrophosphokinase